MPHTTDQAEDTMFINVIIKLEEIVESEDDTMPQDKEFLSEPLFVSHPSQYLLYNQITKYPAFREMIESHLKSNAIKHEIKHLRQNNLESLL